MKILFKSIVLFIFFFYLSCSPQPKEGDECDDYGKRACGHACVQLDDYDPCAQMAGAVLYCDGYIWMVLEKCSQDQCSCVEKNDSVYCECDDNYYY
jgi:hypothetical protein